MGLPGKTWNNKGVVGALLVAGVLLVVGLGVVTGRGASRNPDALGDQPTFVVRRGPLSITVGVSGTIKPREQEILKSEVEGQTTILSIVSEGTKVKEGDLLVELDASRLMDEKVDQEIRVQNAEAAYIGARENLEVTKNQAESDVDKAQLALRFAEEDLKNYLDGEYPKELKEVESRIILARGNLKRAEEDLKGSRRLAAKDFITTNELEIDEQAALKAKLDLELVEADKELLVEFTHGRQVAQLESDLKQAGMALERADRKAAADVVQAEASLKAKQAEFERQQSKLEKILEQIEKATIYAPIDGQVVYATTGQGGHWRQTVEPLDEGQMVRERQELIHLPKTASFEAEVAVHEASLTKVARDMPVRITVDALPERTFRGVVTAIAPLPDARSAWMNPDLKVYNTDIDIEGDVAGLRTGMSCRGEIIVEKYEDAVYVPVQAVVRVAGRPTVYVVEGGTSGPREVELGLDNNRMAHILSGLEAGERVLLAPPLAAGDEIPAEDGQAPPSEPGEPAASTTGERPRDAATAPGEDVQRQERGGPPGPPQEEFRGSQDERRGRRGGPGGFQDASPEERERMRLEWQKRLENASPEEREQMRQRREERFKQPSPEEQDKAPSQGREHERQGSRPEAPPPEDSARK